MSGGSFNYLYRAQDLEDLSNHLYELDEMACALAELGYAPDAAQETADLLARIRSANAHAQASTGRLSEVWKAVEWARGGDWPQSAVGEALATYRGKGRTLYELTPEEAKLIDLHRAAPDPTDEL